jgi:N-acetylglucosaminyl-diphospho-decaprenol L-rhamnosyltransferase
MNWPPGRRVRHLIVMTVYRSADLAVECLRTLSKQIEDVPDSFVGICENGSGQEELQKLIQAVEAEGWSNWVGILPVHPNRGFTGGNNAIISETLRWPTPPDDFLLLNTDTLVGLNALRVMHEFISADPRLGIVGPQLTWPDGRPQQCCFRDPTIIGQMLAAARTGLLDSMFRRSLTPKPLPHETGPHDWKTFACALIRREVFEQIGLLDEGYFLYMDDPDFCFRARRAGWSVGHCDDCSVVHLKGGSNDVPASVRERRRLPRYYYVSRSRYLAKRYGIAGLWLANLCWHAGRVISWTRELVERRPSHLPQSQWRDIWTNALRPWHAPHLPYPEEPAETAASTSEPAVTAAATS